MIARSAAIPAVVVAATVLLFAALSVPIHAGATTSPAPSPTITTPTTHSYDDSHTDQQAPGSNPAFWILGAAAICLVAIATIMLRAGRPARTHLARGAHPPDQRPT